jgi:hypothetical protein
VLATFWKMSQREFIEEETTKLFLALESHNASAFIDLIEDHIQSEGTISRDFILTARDKRDGHWGDTLLHRAVNGGYIWQARYLMEIGANINAICTSSKKDTPLMHAITANDESMAIFLVSTGASLMCLDINNENAFHYFARYGTVTMLRACVSESRLPPEILRDLSSCPNSKMKFPEDIAKDSLMKESLMLLRESGSLRKLSKKKSTMKKRRRGKKSATGNPNTASTERSGAFSVATGADSLP